MMLPFHKISSLPIELRRIVTSKKDFRDIVEDKRLAKIGDCLLNLLNVLAIASGQLTRDSKVTNRMLRRVSEAVGLRPSLRKRIKEKEVGDAIEALIAYWYLKGLFSGQELLEETKRVGSFDIALANLIRKLAREEGYLS